MIEQRLSTVAILNIEFELAKLVGLDNFVE
jgi:hypothetical protein